MLHDDEGVAQIAQTAERFEQLVVVALVQADARLVKDIQHAHQRRADLRGQTDALRLSAGERPGRARKRQILQADIFQKAEAVADLLQDRLGDHSLRALEPEAVQKVQLPADGETAELRDGQAADCDRPRNIREPLAAAVRAGRGRHIFLQLLAHRVGLCLAEAALKVGQDALEGLLERAAAVAALIAKLQLFPARAEENDLHGLVRQALDRRVQVEAVFLSQSLEIHPRDGVVADVAPAAGLDAAVIDRLFRIGNDQLRVGLEPITQARALRTGAHRIVERK